LISTTVIGSGNQCARATMMIVEDADRFGLAQLHQLRDGWVEAQTGPIAFFSIMSLPVGFLNGFGFYRKQTTDLLSQNRTWFSGDRGNF